jgi:hypothetical protein
LLHKHLPLAALLIWVLIAPFSLKAQSDNFDDGNDAGWTRYDPIGGAVGSARGTWSFPNGAYRIQTLGSPSPSTLGQARVASVRNDVIYTDFYLAVDVVAWDDTLRQAFGLLGRLGQIGLGQTTGYAFTYQAITHDIQINRITSEAPTGISATVAVTLDPTKKYRMIFAGIGPIMSGRIYELPNIDTPIVSVTANSDSTYPSGAAGLLVYDNSSAKTAPADATFDNYLANDQPPPALSMRNDSGTLRVSWPASAGDFNLQCTAILTPPAWTNITDGILPSGDNTLEYAVPAPGASKFFRLVK